MEEPVILIVINLCFYLNFKYFILKIDCSCKTAMGV